MDNGIYFQFLKRTTGAEQFTPYHVLEKKICETYYPRTSKSTFVIALLKETDLSDGSLWTEKSAQENGILH